MSSFPIKVHSQAGPISGKNLPQKNKKTKPGRKKEINSNRSRETGAKVKRRIMIWKGIRVVGVFDVASRREHNISVHISGILVVAVDASGLIGLCT